MAQKSGVNIKKMLEIAHDCMDMPPTDREKHLRSIALYIDSWCSGVNTYRGGICSLFRERYNQQVDFGFGRHYGNYLVTLSLGVKVVYFLNAIVQLIFLNEFLGGQEFYVYGYDVIHDVFIRGVWPGGTRFPTVTLCDFDLRQIENVQRFTLQCVLPINLFNEKFFIFLWFWITIVAIGSLLSLLKALYQTLQRDQKVEFTKKYLLMNSFYDYENYHMNKLVRKFTENHLRQDGIYLLQLIAENTSSIFVTDVIEYLWEIYLKRIYRARKPNGHNGYHVPNKDMMVYMKDPPLYESCV